MRIFHVLYVTRSTAGRFSFDGRGDRFFENFGIVTSPAGRAWKSSIDIFAHVATLVTTATGQHFGPALIGDAIDTLDNANTSEMDAMELCAAPLLILAGIDAILFQERYYFRLLG